MASNVKDTFSFTKEPKSINEFDETVGRYNDDDVAIGNFLKFHWFPGPAIRFYDFNAFLSENAHLTLNFCTDSLLVRLYKECICLIAHLRNISITSFPEEQLIVKEKLQTNENYERSFILSNQQDSFYKLYTYRFEKEMEERINIYRLNVLIDTLNERGLSDKVLMNPEDISNIFSAKEIIKSQSGQNIFFFSNIPTNGNNFELLDKYLDSVTEYIAEREKEKDYISLNNLRFFLNDFTIMYKTLNQNKDEYFKKITTKYLTICSTFTENHPGFIGPKYCTFSKDLAKLKKQKTTFASSILEIKKEVSNIEFENFDTKTVVVSVVEILKYQRDKYNKALEPKYIKSTFQSNFERLKVGVSAIHGDDIYLTFFNYENLEHSIFNQAIDEFMNLMLSETINPKRNFIKEYEILINKAVMENDIFKSGQESNITKVLKVNKF